MLIPEIWTSIVLLCSVISVVASHSFLVTWFPCENSQRRLRFLVTKVLPSHRVCHLCVSDETCDGVTLTPLLPFQSPTTLSTSDNLRLPPFVSEMDPKSRGLKYLTGKRNVKNHQTHGTELKVTLPLLFNGLPSHCG